MSYSNLFLSVTWLFASGLCLLNASLFLSKIEVKKESPITVETKVSETITVPSKGEFWIANKGFESVRVDYPDGTKEFIQPNVMLHIKNGKTIEGEFK